LARYPELKTDMDKVIADLQTADPKTMDKGLMDQLQRDLPDRWVETCKDLNSLDKYKADPNGNKDLGYQPCQLDMGQNYFQGLIKTLAQLDLPDADRKTALSRLVGRLKNQRDAITAKPRKYTGDGERDCRYDPLATRDTVNKIAALPCVSNVLVPDPFLVQSADGDGKTKVLSYPLDATDRYGVTVKDNCSGLAKLPGVGQ
jgi:hypothetical protein